MIHRRTPGPQPRSSDGDGSRSQSPPPSFYGVPSVPYRVLVTDKLAEEGLAPAEGRAGLEVVVDTKLAKDPAALKARWPRPTAS